MLLSVAKYCYKSLLEFIIIYYLGFLLTVAKVLLLRVSKECEWPFCYVLVLAKGYY